VNWAINIGILVLIIASYVAYRAGAYHIERIATGLLVLVMAITVFYGVLTLRRMQTDYDLRAPGKVPK
jgi:hypothetical protein